MFDMEHELYQCQEVMPRPISVRDYPETLKSWVIRFCYAPNWYVPNKPYMGEILKRQKFVEKIRDYLVELMKKHKKYNKIICLDVINPNLIPGLKLEQENGRWNFRKHLFGDDKAFKEYYNIPMQDIVNSGHYTLIQDEQFLLAMRVKREDVEIYIFKK